MDMQLAPASLDNATSTTASKLPAVAGTVDSLRNWLDAAKKFETGKLFAQVMAGLELKALWKASNLSQGKRTDLSQVGTSSDRDQIIAQVGLSKTQAYRLMEMAEAALPRLRKASELAGLDILATPIAAMEPATAGALEGAVRKLTEGRSQQDFFAEMGLYKKPSKGPGGAREPGEGASEEVTKELAIEQARNDFNVAERTLVIAGANFTLLVDQEVAAQVHVLQMMIDARNKWLRTPKGRRDSTAVAALRADLEQRHRSAMAAHTRGEFVGELPEEESIDARG
jgi:hypothetical protein